MQCDSSFGNVSKKVGVGGQDEYFSANSALEDSEVHDDDDFDNILTTFRVETYQESKRTPGGPRKPRKEKKVQT
eukprot:scaffold1886_cov157-Chaetoceros_neogracile.AAC.2